MLNFGEDRLRDDSPFFMLSADDPEKIWTLTLLGGAFTGSVAWMQVDSGGCPIMITLDQGEKKPIEIPWTAIQCVTYEGTKNAA